MNTRLLLSYGISRPLAGGGGGVRWGGGGGGVGGGEGGRLLPDFSLQSPHSTLLSASRYALQMKGRWESNIKKSDSHLCIPRN